MGRAAMDLEGFADLWEHVRLLSDQRRNDALFTLLARRAPGATVLEIGCGSGLLACVAAKLGAKRVIAVEPTEQAEAAQILVDHNGLHDVVEVVQARIEELRPRPVDLAFSELLNAEPLAEGVFEAMDAAARWVAGGGRLAPRRLRLWTALVRDPSSAVEVREVQALLERLERAHGLDLAPLRGGIDTIEPYRYVSPELRPVSRPVCIADVALGTGERPEPHQRLRLPVTDAGPVGGAAVWFEAELDDGLALANGPGEPGHWGHLVLGWPEERGAARDGEVEVDVWIDDEQVTVTPAD